MKKCTDRDILRKYNELEEKQNLNAVTLADFRLKFNEYQRAKRNRKINHKSVCTPYVEVFQQPRLMRKH